MEDYITNIEEIDEDIDIEDFEATAPEVSFDYVELEPDTEDEEEGSTTESDDTFYEKEYRRQHPQEYEEEHQIYDQSLQRRIAYYQIPHDQDIIQREFYMAKARFILDGIEHAPTLITMIGNGDVAGLNEAIDTVNRYILQHTHEDEILYDEYQDLAAWIWNQIWNFTTAANRAQIILLNAPLLDHDLLPIPDVFDAHCPIM